MEDVNQVNTDIRTWAKATLGEIKSRYQQLVAGESGNGGKSIRLQTHRSFGEIDRVSIRFNRYLIYVHKGAGKGRGGEKGSTWLGPNGRKSTNPASLGKMNRGSRREKPWLNPVLDQSLPSLADTLLKVRGHMTVKSIQIK